MSWKTTEIDDCIYSSDFKNTIPIRDLIDKLNLTLLEDIQDLVNNEELEVIITGTLSKGSKQTLWEPAEPTFFEDIRVYYNDIDITDLINESKFEEFNDSLFDGLHSKEDLY